MSHFKKLPKSAKLAKCLPESLFRMHRRVWWIEVLNIDCGNDKYTIFETQISAAKTLHKFVL